MPMVQRDEETSADIAKLCNSPESDVADLFTPLGKALYRWMTAAEKDHVHQALPMRQCPNFDGEACDFCRGLWRFRQCRECHGEQIPVHLRPPRDPVTGAYLVKRDPNTNAPLTEIDPQTGRYLTNGASDGAQPPAPA